MTKQVLSFLLGTLNFILLSQAPVIQWQKSFGGAFPDFANSIIQNPADSGFVFAGSSSSNNGNVPLTQGLDDFVIMKTSLNGTLLWEHAYGGTDYDAAYCINKTSDGGYIVCGEVGSSNGDVTVNYGDSDFWVLKLNSSGVLQWQKSYGGTSEDNASYVMQTSDGGYIVAGYATSTDFDVTGNHGLGDYWVVKISVTGSIQWEKTFGGSSLDYGYVILQTTDGGFVVCGTSQSNDGDVTGNHGLEDYWVVKLNNLGVIQWEHSYGGSGNDYAYDIKQTADGGYIVCGKSNSINGDINDNHGNHDYWVVKITSLGAIQWKKSYGGSQFEIASSVIQTTTGDYIITGQSNSVDGDRTFTNGVYDNWLIKVNGANGNIVWQKDFGGSNYENSKCVIPTIDGGLMVCGESISNDVDVSGNHGADDMWIVKFNYPLDLKEKNKATLFSFFPNPAKNEIAVKTQEEQENVNVVISDVSGKEVYNSSSISINNYASFKFEIENGMYFIKITSGNNLRATSKLIIAK